MRMRALTLFVGMLAGAAGMAGTARAADELPLTEAFTDVLGQYRDCVVGAVARTELTRADAMASTAIATCRASHDAALRQLATDISTASPHVSARTAAQQATKAMASVQPMIDALALSQAHEMIDSAAAQSAAAPPNTIIG